MRVYALTAWTNSVKICVRACLYDVRLLQRIKLSFGLEWICQSPDLFYMEYLINVAGDIERYELCYY